MGNGDSSVGIAKGYGLEGGGSISGGARDSSQLHTVRTGSGAY
jgi:hypothetical protein